MEMFFAFIPMMIVLGLYIIIIGLCIWFVVMFFKRQKERNEALQKIAKELKQLNREKKAE